MSDKISAVAVVPIEVEDQDTQTPPEQGKVRAWFDDAGNLKVQTPDGAVRTVEGGGGGGGGSGLPTPEFSGVLVAAYIGGNDYSVGWSAAPTDGKRYILTQQGGLLAWVDAALLVGSGGGSGPALVPVELPFTSLGGPGDLIDYLGRHDGVDSSFTNPCVISTMFMTASGSQFSGNASDVWCCTDRATNTGTQALDCVVVGGTRGGQWVRFDVGSGRQMQVKRVCVQQRGTNNGNADTAYGPFSELILKGSPDQTTFTELGRVYATDQHTATWAQAIITGAAAYRYLQIEKVGLPEGQDDSNLLCIGEVQFWGTFYK